MTHRPSDEPAERRNEVKITLMSVTLVLFCIWLVLQFCPFWVQTSPFSISRKSC